MYFTCLFCGHFRIFSWNVCSLRCDLLNTNSRIVDILLHRWMTLRVAYSSLFYTFAVQALFSLWATYQMEIKQSEKCLALKFNCCFTRQNVLLLRSFFGTMIVRRTKIITVRASRGAHSRTATCVRYSLLSTPGVD